MPMGGFYTPAELAYMRGGGESTYRQRAAAGEYLHATKQGNTWFIPLRDIDKWGRDYDKEFADPQPLDPKFPHEQNIVLAQNSDGRHGIYIDDDWYGAGQALSILSYLEKHKTWLEEKAIENDEKRDE